MHLWVNELYRYQNARYNDKKIDLVLFECANMLVTNNNNNNNNNILLNIFINVHLVVYHIKY